MTHVYLAPLFNHLWQSTLCAAAAWILTRALRENRAAVRYGVWLAASLKFLVPFSALVYVGERFGWRAAPVTAQPQWLFVAGEIGRPFPSQTPAVGAASLPPSHASLFLTLLVSVWLLGFVASLALWFRRWRQIRAIRKAATPLSLALPIPVLCSPSLQEPGIFGIFRPVFLLPENITNGIDKSELDAIVAHEICHVRRRDNLTAAIHMFVDAVFWFYPPVRWIGWQLLAERERACDDYVLQAGTDPAIYAEAILSVCKLCVESPLACVSGVTGADLKGRIARIMSQPLIRKLGAGRKLLLVAAAAAAIAGPVAFGLANPTLTSAQSAPAADNSLVASFESVSIRPNLSGGPRTLFIHPGNFTMTNMPVRSLVEFAYDVKAADQLSGVPDWLTAEQFDLEAKESDALNQQLDKLPPEQREQQLKRMLQSVLADRFKLKVGYETKVLPTYALFVADGGAKLAPTSLPPPDSPEAIAAAKAFVNPPAVPPPPDPSTGVPPPPKGFRGIFILRGQLVATAAQVSQLADSISRNLGHQVLDQTGLTGSYDFTLKWTPKPGEMLNGPLMPGPTPDPSGPSLLAALENQLGLKLVPQDRPARVMVIDHVEEPSPN
ncbi:MAG: M56 family metallopeptidase [Candidatus Acidiferrales bacterium]